MLMVLTQMRPLVSRNRGPMTTLRSMPFGRCGLAKGSYSVRPVAKQVKRLLDVEPADVARHEHLCIAGSQSPRPSIRCLLRLIPKLLGHRAGPWLSHRVATLAGATLDDVQPFAWLSIFSSGNSSFFGT